MPKRLDKSDVVAMLKDAVESYGQQKRFAEAHGLSSQYVNDVMLGRRDPGESILKALKLKRIVYYERD